MLPGGRHGEGHLPRAPGSGRRLPTPPARVVGIDPATDPRWDGFVDSFPGASAYHLSAWARILKDAYGCDPEYLALESSQGQIEGVLPLMRTWGLLAGTRYRSLPVLPPAGPLAATDEGKRALIAAACALAASRGVSWTVLAREDGYQELVAGVRLIRRQTNWVLPLPGDPEDLRASWRKRAKNLHRSLNKAEAGGVTVYEGTSNADLRRFYGLYLHTMRRHRALPRTWRQIVRDRDLLAQRGAFRLFIVAHEKRAIAAGLFHAHGETVDLLYNGSDDRFLDVRPNHALYWGVIRWSIAAGLRRFDFGTAATESSLGRFKRQWGTEPFHEYRYEYDPNGAGSRAASLRQVNAISDETLLKRVWGHAPVRATELAATLAYRWLV
jgi:CelD/BcsL family acetyltransferase involved in cellulose biosynthesis